MEKPRKTNFITFRVSQSLKEKLYTDARRFNYPSVSAYLCDLIGRGMQVSEPLDIRLQLIEKKIDAFSSNQVSFNERFLSRMMFMVKRLLVVYKVVANVLARVMTLFSGEISDDILEKTNYTIETEFARIEKRFENEIE